MWKILFFVFLISLASAQSLPKPGDCPPSSSIGICSITCFEDVHCRGDSKCCKTDCGGSICVKPIIAKPLGHLNEKPGICPRPSGPWVCTSRCNNDKDCRGRSKCCKNRCGAMACTQPEMY